MIGSLTVAFFSLQLSRLVFYLNLTEYFEASKPEVLNAFLMGFRFDAVSIAYGLGWFFLLIPFLDGLKRKSIIIWAFLLILAGMNFLNCIDAEFFKFTARRSTDDLFEFAFLSDDIINIAPNLIGHFWYLILAFLVITAISTAAVFLLFNPTRSSAIRKNDRKWHFLVTGLLILVLARGGVSGIPLSIIDASTVNPPHLKSVALSTPFTILKTLFQPELRIYQFPDEEVEDLTPIKNPTQLPDSSIFRNHNVVLIIVESLGLEYVGSLNGLGHSYTPFLDSLFEKSLVFENGYANGHRSIEGIASITASIPTLMYEPFTTSCFAENEINSLALLLGEMGYHSSFMHGGNKNSMNFESFGHQAGYDVFYDRDDYPKPEEHYDGVWGIPDHFMLKQCVEENNSYPKPFFSTIFTLSSHHPYTIPEGYQERFPEGTLPIHESLGYTDQSLREFFGEAAKTEWYDNTLFVITADHTSLSDNDEFQTRAGSLRIPIVFFHPDPDRLVGRNSKTVQQIDIMPTILDLCGYTEPYFAFGSSAFCSDNSGFSVAFKNDQFQLVRNNQLICFDGNKTNFVYNTIEDPLLQINLVDSTSNDYVENEAFLKGFIQNYSVALNFNAMTKESWSERQE